MTQPFDNGRKNLNNKNQDTATTDQFGIAKPGTTEPDYDSPEAAEKRAFDLAQTPKQKGPVDLAGHSTETPEQKRVREAKELAAANPAKNPPLTNTGTTPVFDNHGNKIVAK